MHLVIRKILIAGLVLFAPILKAAGLHKIHLDVRTPPVTVHGWKRKLDSAIFWHLSLKLFSSMTASQSFITQQLKEEVERVSNRRFAGAHLWSSGASVSSFDLGPRAVEAIRLLLDPRDDVVGEAPAERLRLVADRGVRVSVLRGQR